MAKAEHLRILKKGVMEWNKWRDMNPQLEPELNEADLRGTNLRRANLSNSNLRGANLRGADLSEASLYRARLSEANLSEANLRGADLGEANLEKASLIKTVLTKSDLYESNLYKANLSKANLFEANLTRTNLNRANLLEVNLMGASLLHTNLENANLKYCSIYGISAWDLELKGSEQEDLIITPWGAPKITVDNIEVAQFIYLLLHNEKIRHVIDTITSKVVLILGRFTPQRKSILDMIREELRKRDYLPVLFDFKPPINTDFVETVKIIANLAKFVIADITSPKIVKEELVTLVPTLPSVPFQILLHRKARRPYITFPFVEKYNTVLPICYYNNLDDLMLNFEERVIKPAESKVIEIKNIKKY
jgi:hypothetical protein